MSILVSDPFGVAGDQAMPSLELALDPELAQQHLRDRLPRLAGKNGSVQLRTIRVTRYKPGRRCVIEYEVGVERPDGSPEAVVLVGKVMAHRYGKSGYRLLEAFWRAGFQSGSPDGISVPEPVGHVPKFQMWLQRKVSGRAATALLAAPGGVALARRIAEAADKLHRAKVPTERRHTMADELRILHERLPTVAQAEPQWAGRIERLLEACDHLGTATPKPTTCGIHRDFYADQVIVNGERLFLLDFDLYCEGDPALDIGNFLGHITEQSLRTLGDAGALADREHAMEERFAELSGTAPAAVRAYATLTLVRHVYLSTLFPERRPFTQSLIELSEERLGVARHRRSDESKPTNFKEARPITGRSLSLLMYSHDGFGLGHLRRNTAIATRFVEEMSGSTALMLVGCPGGAFFELPPGVDFIKVPSIIKVGTGLWRPRTLRLDVEKTRAIRAATILKAAELFKPDVFLVDYTPTGVWGELLPTLQMLKGQKDPPKVILGLRDILDAPEVTRELWRKDRAYDAISQYYDGVFIYGCREVFDTAAQYGLDGALAGKVTFCGYLCSDEGDVPKAPMREDLQLADNKLVVVTAGGGHDAYPMMRTCMEAFRLIGKDLPLAVVITGPLMEHEQMESLRRQAKGLPVRMLRYVNDLGYMNAADVVITMASYNTLLDAIRLRKRILAIPREGPSAEQRIRSEVFSRLGLVQAIRPEQLSPSLLAQAILHNLDAGPITPVPLRMDALTTVVHQMRRLLQPDTAQPTSGAHVP